MFDDVDESLRALLVADVPIDPAEVEIAFARPTREWSSRVAGPTVNLFLFDIRERTDFRDDTWRVTRAENGMVTREHPPRRVDLSYLLTAWTREPEDEHRILARVLACMYRNLKLPPEHLKGALETTDVSVHLRPMPPDHIQKPVDFWGVMDNELRAGFTWVVTAPLDAFAPITGPMVRTKEIGIEPMAQGNGKRLYQVGGITHQAGSPQTGLEGVRVTVAGSGLGTVSGRGGRYSLSGIGEGAQRLRIEAPGLQPFEHAITVPGESYDVPIPGESGAARGSPRRGTRAENS